MSVRRSDARPGASRRAAGADRDAALGRRNRRPARDQERIARSQLSGAQSRDSASTTERLLRAATLEFNEQGFDGTDTNRIARRAGFAPQTFYRWFKDKEAIFIATYERWRDEQFEALSRLRADNASDARLAQVVVAHHKRYLVFRRSLRQLAVNNDAIRTARARSRLEQLEWMKTLSSRARDAASLAAILLQIERLADALAEGELRDMGLDESACEAALAGLIHELRAS
jgi:AcrR family transcriptional regulator